MAKKKAKKAPLAWLDEREFYDYMRAYRLAPATDPEVVVEQFEAVKRFIRRSLGKVSMTNATFKDCPFCGSDEIFIESARAPDEGSVAVCGLCNGTGPNCETEQGAIRAWNDRGSQQHGAGE